MGRVYSSFPILNTRVGQRARNCEPTKNEVLFLHASPPSQSPQDPAADPPASGARTLPLWFEVSGPFTVDGATGTSPPVLRPFSGISSVLSGFHVSLLCALRRPLFSLLYGGSVVCDLRLLTYRCRLQTDTSGSQARALHELFPGRNMNGHESSAGRVCKLWEVTPACGGRGEGNGK